MAAPGFVHLHVHSSYSLLEGALPLARLADLAKADRQRALALTDTDNMFGALEFSDKMAGAGIQPMTQANLVRFIRHAPTVKPGARMPAYPQMTNDDAATIARWLEQLK